MESMQEVVYNCIEEDAKAVYDRVGTQAAIEASIAISLKRIADLLDGTTLGINVADTVFNTNR